MMYSLDEVSIIPSTFTSVKSRKDIITTYTSKLPIFVAPMTCLVDFINFSSFTNNHYNIVWLNFIITFWKEEGIKTKNGCFRGKFSKFRGRWERKEKRLLASTYGRTDQGGRGAGEPGVCR